MNQVNLNYLDLSHNHLHIRSGKEIGKMLETNIGLKTLILGWNKLYPETGERVQYVHQVTLHLNSHGFCCSSECIIPLMKGLTKNINIVKVDLSWNGLMGETLAKMLRKLFMKNKILAEIDLQYNRWVLGTAGLSFFFNHSKRISGPDCVSFSRAFKKSQTLKCVFLGGNPISQQDIKQILAIIRMKNSLSILSFGRSTRLIKECADLAVKIMEKYPELRIIYNDALLDRPPKTVDFTAILIDRCRYLCMRPKNEKLKKDLGHFFLKVLDDEPQLCSKETFLKLLSEFNNKLEGSIGEQIAVDWTQSTGKKSKGGKVALHKMAKYYLDRYPTEKPAPPIPESKIGENEEIKLTD